jgi:hypothetical protein
MLKFCNSDRVVNCLFTFYVQNYNCLQNFYHKVFKLFSACLFFTFVRLNVAF